MKKYAFARSLINGLIITSLIAIAACSNRIPNPAIQTRNSDENNWKIVGPGAGGGVFIPTVSPIDTNLVFSKGDMTGAFVSYNGGKNWKQFNLMSLVKDFEFDPVDPDIVYASSRGYLYEEDRGSGLTLLYKSENRGKTWNVIYPDIKKIAPLEKIQSMSFLPSELVKDMPDGSIDLIKVDPANTNCIFLGLSPLLFSTLGHPKLNNRANFFCSSLISKIWATVLNGVSVQFPILTILEICILQLMD